MKLNIRSKNKYALFRYVFIASCNIKFLPEKKIKTKLAGKVKARDQS